MKLSTNKSVAPEIIAKCAATKRYLISKTKFISPFKLPLAYLLFISSLSLSAQDVISKIDKTELKAKVVEITLDAVKYKEWDNQSGPVYNISKSQVFMITYQNGKREYMGKTADALSNTAAASETNTGVATSKDPRFVFTPRDKNQQKSKANYADRLGNIGFNLNTIGKTTIPTISIVTDILFAPNIAFSIGSTLGYNSQEIMGYSSSSFTAGLMAGGSYYLNEVLKLDKTKASAYGGLMVSYINTSVTSDMPAGNLSSSGFGFFLRGGGRYHLSKRLGIFGEIQVGEGDPSFVAGLSILTFK